MSSRIDSQAIKNPFIPYRPARADREFVGRLDAIQWVQSSLGQAPASEPLTIGGSPGIGKTSLLHRLVVGGLGDEIGVLYADLRSMDTASMSTFLWQLAKAIMDAMKEQGLDGPRIEKRMLVLNPQLVFRQRFWQPLLSKSRELPLLLAWDNFDALAERSNGDPQTQIIRAYLFGLLETESHLDVLLTVSGRVAAIAENSLSPFRLERSYRLTSLTRAQALQLVHSCDLFPVFGPVGEYIYELTAGHPRDLQRLCHALFKRHHARRHSQVTAADVLAVLQQDLSPSDFRGAVYHALAQAPFAISPTVATPTTG